MEIHQTKNLNKVISTPYLLGATSKLTTPTARPYSCPNLRNFYVTAMGFIEFRGLHIHKNSLRIAFPDCDISFLWAE